MLVTIYTDASFKNGHAAGAAWVKSNLGTLKLTKTYIAKDSIHSEGLMIYYSLDYVLKTWEGISTVLINTDCLAYCKFIRNKHSRNNTRPDLRKGAELIIEMCKNNNVKLRIKHVKGHQGNKNLRAWLNTWCDRQARKARIN